MKEGFYTALGTPVNEVGELLASSLVRHVEDQLTAKPAGLLVMGSMGIQPGIKDSEYVKVARTAVEAAKGECPVQVGVMDNSASRVAERIRSLKGLPIDGVVATTPFYYPLTQPEVVSFFTAVAAASSYPVYLYDLPGVTKTKITAATAEKLMKHPNIAGIKTGDLATARVLHRSKRDIKPDFHVLFSGLDLFDAAYEYGIRKNLDGMFSCTAALTGSMYRSLERGDVRQASDDLDGILKLRDLFVEVGVFPGFTAAMNLLGFEGIFHPDYMSPLAPEQADRVKSCMQAVKLIG